MPLEWSIPMSFRRLLVFVCVLSLCWRLADVHAQAIISGPTGGGVGGSSVGTAGVLQAANGAGGLAAFGGSACPIAGTFMSGLTATG